MYVSFFMYRILRSIKLSSFIYLFVIISVFLIFMVNPLFEWVSYNLYYKPLYLLFVANDSGYFSFYLYFVRYFFLSVLGIAVFVCLTYSVFYLKDGSKTKTKKLNRVGTILGFIFFLILVLFLTISYGVECIKDIPFIKNRKYEVVVWDTCEVRRGVRRKSNSITYKVLNYTERQEHNDLSLNIYQYRALISILKPINNDSPSQFRLPEGKSLKISYLPNTKIILRYELVCQK